MAMATFIPYFPPTKFSFFPPMASSEIQQQVIRLGKQLAESLGDTHDVDTFSRWLAYYIGEQIALSENSVGDQRAAAEQRCFDTILKLWKHRTFMSRGHRPFEKFEPIFRTLERLDPDEPRSFYHSFRARDNSVEDDTVIKLMQFIEAADQAARVLIDQALSLSICTAEDEHTKSLLKDAIGDHEDKDVMMVGRLIGKYGGNHENPPTEAEELAARLKRHIGQLDEFTQMSLGVRKVLTQQLKALESQASQD